MSQEIAGVLTALSTPFGPDEQIDTGVLRQLVDRSIDGGVGGVVAGGSTGEFAALSAEERLLLVDTVVEQAAGRVPVIAQTGATTTREAISLSQAAERSGADVLMLVTPYYEALSLDETVAYIRDVTAAVGLPVMLYNIPDATGVNLDPHTIGTLAHEDDRIRFVKDSSANYEQALQLIHHHGDVIRTFIGWDSYTFSALVEGAAGVMAGAANVIPAELVAVHARIAVGDLAGALEQWKRIYPVVDALLSAPFIASVKAGLRYQGIAAGVPRRPVGDLSAADAARVELALDTLLLADGLVGPRP
jgi:4-hydroxy-tetrahydrodipicolinate synthase